MRNKIKKYLTAYNVFLGFIVALNFFAFLAPVLMALGLPGLAKPIYFVYSFFCHQIHYRSLHLFGYQVAWCTRDSFIWFSMLMAAIAVKYVNYRGLKWFLVVVFVIPIALDGGIQLIATMFGLASSADGAFYVSTNFTRMVTGSLLGIGLGLWIFPTLREMDLKAMEAAKKKVETKSWKIIISIFTICFIFYEILLGVWYITSKDYRPLNVIDHTSRLPENKNEWFIRRKHATCPTDLEDSGLLTFNCKTR